MLLEVRNLHKAFGGVTAVADTSFAVAERSITALIGRDVIGTIAIDRCTDRILRLRIGAGTAAAHSYLPAAPRCTQGDSAAEAPLPVQTAEKIELREPAGAGMLRLLTAHCAQDDHSTRLRVETVSEQHFHGLGHGGQPFDRLGATRRLWNCHVNHGGGSDIAIRRCCPSRLCRVRGSCSAGLARSRPVARRAAVRLARRCPRN